MAQDPFLRPRLTVKKRRLPFRILEVFRGRALKEVGRLLIQAQTIINSEVENAQPDPTDNALAGTVEVPPEENLRTDKISPASPTMVTKALARRRAYGGPLSWMNIWSKASSERLANRIDPEVFLPENKLTGVLTGEDGYNILKDVAVSDIWLVGTMTRDSLQKALLNPYGQHVKLLYNEKRKGYIVINGFNTVLAAKLSHALTVRAYVEEEGATYGEEEWYRKALEVELILGPLLGSTRSKAYMLLSAFEPLAQSARRLSREDFLALALSQNTDEEDRAYAASEGKYSEQRQMWVRLYDHFKDEEKKSQKEAARLASEDDRYRRVTSVAEAYRNKSQAIADKWRIERTTFDQRKQQSNILLGVDHLNIVQNTKMYEAIWDQVTKAEHKKKRRPVYG